MIQIEVDDREVRRVLSDLTRRVSDMTPAMHRIGQALMEGARDRIFSGKDWTGTPFAPNSPVTIARKGKNRPLIDKRDFVSHRLHYEAARDSVVVGSSAVQSAVLQFGAKKGEFGKTKRGTPIPWGNIPPRRYLPVTQSGAIDDEARSLILRIISEYLNGD